MAKLKGHENYPCSTVIIANLVSLAIYAIGAYIVYQVGLVWLVIYIIYILALEYRLMSRSCVNCYYYGKFCAFGKGKISSLLFRRGDAKLFLKDNITWKDILPDFLVSLVPLAIGIVLLIMKFSWILLALVAALVLLTTAGNSFVRSTLACRFCRQRELGCPAERLFSKDRPARQ